MLHVQCAVNTTLFGCRLRSLGSAACNMCMVAAGNTDAYFEAGMHCWDIAAGELIVTEAGGVVLDLLG